MTGFRSTIVSPSTVIWTRKTPWVLGCWGPILTTKGSVRRAIYPLLTERKEVLPQRIPFELVPEKDAAQIGMTGESDAEQIVDLALLELRRSPNVDDRGDDWIVTVGRPDL